MTAAPKRRKLRRVARLPLHAIPDRPHALAALRVDRKANRVLSDPRAARLVIDTLLALELRS